MNDSPTILIVGSANMDMVVSLERFAKPGETVLADTFGMYPGGKGANQAVACAKLGGDARLMCKMGRDVFRDKLRSSLERDGVDLQYLLTDKEASTGIALIAVDGDGQNQIVVVSGSNMTLTSDELETYAAAFDEADVVLLQLEIPVKTVMRAAELAQDRGATVVLNPAPAQELPPSLLRRVDFLTPNESEAEVLAGMRVSTPDEAVVAGEFLLDRGVGRVLITMGEQGAVLVTREFNDHFPAARVDAVDTTAAGDAFSGALALAIGRGQSLDEAIPFASRVAAYSVTRRGAQVSMPSEEELAAFSSDGDHRAPGDRDGHDGRYDPASLQI